MYPATGCGRRAAGGLAIGRNAPAFLFPHGDQRIGGYTALTEFVTPLQAKVDEYVDARTLHKNLLFQKLLQALIELSETGSGERSLLESISNHISARLPTTDRQRDIFQS